ncbi:hydroxyethylthiazole kinase [Halolactibacillus alkaliphilus]|uniref:Hydroxyethylthiazole kinase n=1 Tax=Halolactibacillus alkaliphilus TaxID=442899 RepID=A0A511X3E8_9BACI|nr:hydroxyethylthiazole kinase [Halolactibacillus alkaliphilus]GEN57474.1 hydroxyethylthiazole kinase [Halolactibacillus alkaliphilus]GGN73987.1 hydroxyethylthiazole kinase [Halolactibacillus alkaliphilus]SFO99725.1 hydroxyethylthiazole kinase [Halolactibacillus alkaliphilus]
MEFIEKVRERAPLIHNITNQVVMNITANGLYALGASPIMAHEKGEMIDIVNIADALVLNIGTLTTAVLESMLIAGKAANKKGIPVVLDPVGVGASKFRMRAVKCLLKTLDIALVRGNGAEIFTLATLEQSGKGVEGNLEQAPREIAKRFYERYQVTVVVTGTEDIVYGETGVYLLKNGTELLTKVTGTGCLLTSVIASVLAVVDNQSYVEAAAEAVSYYAIASEMARKATDLPGTFQVVFIDKLMSLTREEWDDMRNFEVITLCLGENG